jgi:CBS domain-containing protein
MRASDVMHVSLVTCAADTTVREAVGRMVDARVGCILVVGDGGDLAGVLSERDILRLCRDSADLGATPVAAAMTRGVLTAPPDAGLDWAAATMADHSVRHLPITEDGRPVGIISMRDLLGLAAEVLRTQGPEAAHGMLAAASRSRG